MIIFQQGAHKTASSFCVQIIRALCAAAGHEQPPPHKTLFFNKISNADPSAARPFQPIKTHGPPGWAREALQDGGGIAFITFRDPLDCIQSLLDHGARKDGEFANEFNDMTPWKALDLHLLHLADSMKWMRLPNVWPIYYDELTQRPHETVAFMAEKLRLSVDPDKLIAEIGAPRRMNVGRSGRGRDVLNLPEGPGIANRLSHLYGFDRWIHGSAPHVNADKHQLDSRVRQSAPGCVVEPDRKIA